MERKSLGFVVVTYDQERRPFTGFLYDSLDRATEDREGMERNSVTAARPERHVVAEVFEVEGGAMEPEIEPVGRRFTDSDGCERVSTPFGFNAYVTQDGAVTGATSIGRAGSTWYIWRLADGSYDYTATEDPDIPGHPAELVETITIDGYGAHKKAIRHA